jgi:hypothetical protein
MRASQTTFMRLGKQEPCQQRTEIHTARERCLQGGLPYRQERRAADQGRTAAPSRAPDGETIVARVPQPLAARPVS